MHTERKKLNDQKRINYSNEMSNLRGVLGSKRLPFQTVSRLMTRHGELKRLGGTEAFAIAKKIFLFSIIIQINILFWATQYLIKSIGNLNRAIANI